MCSLVISLMMKFGIFLQQVIDSMTSDTSTNTMQNVDCVFHSLLV
jgi:hypothetical protein